VTASKRLIRTRKIAESDRGNFHDRDGGGQVADLSLMASRNRELSGTTSLGRNIGRGRRVLLCRYPSNYPGGLG